MKEIGRDRTQTELKIDDEQYKKEFEVESQLSGEKLWDAYKSNRNVKEDGREALSLEGWFWVNSKDRIDDFKTFISVEHEDATKALEILIKNGYFNYKDLPLCQQKVPTFQQINGKGRKAIILYAQGEKTEESTRIWAERLNAIEKDFYLAGIKPRPLVSKDEAAVGSYASDRKFPGSLYSYFKKDVESDQKWDWDKDNYFAGIHINVSQSIEERIKEINKKLNSPNSDQIDKTNLPNLLKAEELYLEISKLGPKETELIQSGSYVANNLKNRTVTQINADGESEEKMVTRERELYFLANNLRRSKVTEDVKATKIKTQNIDIISSQAEAIVNAGNEVLDSGSYQISEPSKATQDLIDKELTNQSREKSIPLTGIIKQGDDTNVPNNQKKDLPNFLNTSSSYLKTHSPSSASQGIYKVGSDEEKEDIKINNQKITMTLGKSLYGDNSGINNGAVKNVSVDLTQNESMGFITEINQEKKEISYDKQRFKDLANAYYFKDRVPLGGTKKTETVNTKNCKLSDKGKIKIEDILKRDPNIISAINGKDFPRNFCKIISFAALAKEKEKENNNTR